MNAAGVTECPPSSVSAGQNFVMARPFLPASQRQYRLAVEHEAIVVCRLIETLHPADLTLAAQDSEIVLLVEVHAVAASSMATRQATSAA